MSMKMFKNRRSFVGLTVAFCTGILFCAAFQLNLFNNLQLYAGDILFKTAGIAQHHSENKIVLVAIDEKSLDQLGRFALWPRSYHADLINILNKNNARLIVFDILFSEPDPDDEKLTASMRAAGNVILPSVCLPSEINPALSDKAILSDSILRPVRQLEDSAIARGHINLIPDTDGTARRLAMVIPDSKTYEPALALATSAKYLRRPTVIEQPAQNGALPFVGRTIPIDNNNEMIINYSGNDIETPTATIPRVSFVDVLKDKVNTELIEDKIVFIGATASGLGDRFWTPLGRMMNGVEIHAIATETILSNNFVREAPPSITIAFILAFAFVCGLIILHVRHLYATVLALSLCLLYFLFVAVCFNRGILLNMFYPPLAIISTMLTINLYSANFDRIRRNEVTKIFGQYVSASVADKILVSLEQGKLKMGGEGQEITVAFADVRGFTGIANAMKPEELVSTLNKYLSVVIHAVMKHHGVINKFGGDSIMAIWNVPTACPDHPILAIKAALEAHGAIRELQQQEPLLPKLDFGIGINTGRAVAGNLGCPERLEYSVIGSTVNLASRITSATPGGKVWISNNTFKLIQGKVAVTPLDDIVIAGKKGRLQAYEVVSIYPDPVFSEKTLMSARQLVKLNATHIYEGSKSQVF